MKLLFPWVMAAAADSFASLESAAAFADKIPAVKCWLGQYESQPAPGAAPK
jgi:hypothetical protein